MLQSTSEVEAAAKHGDPSYYFNRQLLYLAIGTCAMFGAYFIDYRLYRRYAWLIAMVCVSLLVVVLVPHIGKKINGSRRWLGVLGFTIQPSEIGKFGLIVLLSWWMSLKGRRAAAFFSWRPFAMIRSIIEEGCQADKFWPGLVMACCITGLFALPVVAEPDFGTTLVCATVACSIMFVGGCRKGHLAIVGVIGFIGVSGLIMMTPNRVERFLAFLDPEKYRQDEAYQLLNAMYAFVRGGLGGVGFGESLQKQFYLPEAYADFIFPIIGEELGLGAALGVIALFIVYFICGLKISAAAPDNFGRLVAFGITVLITFQAAFNIAVVTGCLPTKGLTLPFISYGGTSLIVSLGLVGVLMNIAKEAEADKARIITAIKDRQPSWY
jgi:cell division protein FtsW